MELKKEVEKSIKKRREEKIKRKSEEEARKKAEEEAKRKAVRKVLFKKKLKSLKGLTLNFISVNRTLLWIILGLNVFIGIVFGLRVIACHEKIVEVEIDTLAMDSSVYVSVILEPDTLVANSEQLNELGDNYYKLKEYEKAVEWYRKAADLGNAKGQNSLGFCYERGIGVLKDSIEAVNWYRKAAEQGYAGGQNNLGRCYEKGIGVPKDSTEAVEYYRKAAKQGHDIAQFNLGFCYERGIGVLKDSIEALKWYEKAADLGNASAKIALERIKLKKEQRNNRIRD